MKKYIICTDKKEKVLAIGDNLEQILKVLII